MSVPAMAMDLPPLHSITAHRALTHTAPSQTDLEKRHSRQDSAEPIPWLDCLYRHRQAFETHEGDTYKHTHTFYKNTKHNGESFSHLAGKGYSVIIAIRFTVKLQQIPYSTGLVWDYCHTCILKL